MNELAKLPRTRWRETDLAGRTFLHYACRGPNLDALRTLLYSGMFDINIKDFQTMTPFHYAVLWNQDRVVELLFAAGANARLCPRERLLPIDNAIWNSRKMKGDDTLRAMIANGVRLCTASKSYQAMIKPEMWVFEYGILNCRAAVVSLLRLKRLGPLKKWDRFLLKEVAFAVWASRREKEWWKR